MKSKVAINVWIALLAALMLLSACSSIPDRDARLQSARDAAPASHRDVIIETRRFDLLSFVHAKPVQSEKLIVFIEGDGFAWERRDRPSSDPTPVTQTVLSLVSGSPNPNIAYLARPCQFVGAGSRNCSQKLWTSERYSEAVVSSLNEALDHLKREYGSSHVILIGYSGGGTIAALVAARRPDVSGFVTLASPLDIRAFADLHQVTPLTGSLNPIDVAHILADIPQIHIVGDQDEIVPPALVRGFIHSLPSDRCARMFTVTANHWSGWTNIDPHPAEITPTCEANTP